MTLLGQIRTSITVKSHWSTDFNFFANKINFIVAFEDLSMALNLCHSALVILSLLHCKKGNKIWQLVIDYLRGEMGDGRFFIFENRQILKYGLVLIKEGFQMKHHFGCV
jgi:hypothetical protein